MLGDVILVEEKHRQAASVIASELMIKLASMARPIVVGISGESGSGKSELARALLDALDARGVRSVILQQDDYYVLPPKSNDQRRREDIGWVGPQEVRLECIDEDIRTILSGAATLEKPLVRYPEDRIDTEVLDVSGCQVVIVEGTYVGLLQTPDERVFIDRTYLETASARRRRAREAPDPFIEHVLTLEHNIVKHHRRQATFLVDRDFKVDQHRPRGLVPHQAQDGGADASE